MTNRHEGAGLRLLPGRNILLRAGRVGVGRASSGDRLSKGESGKARSGLRSPLLGGCRVVLWGATELKLATRWSGKLRRVNKKEKRAE